MKRILTTTAILLAFCVSSWAQEEKNEVTVQANGFFTKTTNSSTISNQPTDSGGVTAGYRYNFNRWFAAEGDYDYFSNSQRYFSGLGLTQIQTNVNVVTGVGVVKLPSLYKVQPYVLAGGGGIFFNPRNAIGLDTQGQGTFVYGGGADWGLMRHVALRAQYRGFVYKIPDFNVAGLHEDAFTHSAVPSVGFVFKF